MWQVAINGILGKSALAPSVGTTHTVNIQVNIQIDETTTLDVIGMMRPFKVFLPIVPSADAERLETLNAEFARVVGYLKPANVASVAIILWMDVLRLILRKRHCVFA